MKKARYYLVIGLAFILPNVNNTNSITNTDKLIYFAKNEETKNETEDSSNITIPTGDGLTITPIDPHKPPEDGPQLVIMPNISYYTNETFNHYFFYNQGKNIIENSIGNCGYTAISMLLSYYDAHWNDDIIPNQYNATTTISTSNDCLTSYNSPGVNNNAIFIRNNNYTLDSDIRNFMNDQISKKGTSLFGLLLDYAVNGHNHYKEYDKQTGKKIELDNIGINYKIVCDILNDYLNNNSVLKSNAKLITRGINAENASSQEKTAMRNEIIEILKQNEPVIIGGTLDEGGHVCIAYEYDEANDIIYGNLGWGKSSVNSHRNLDEFFTVGIADYYYYKFESSFTHKHSYSYYDLSTQEYLCSCMLSSHQHNYVYKLNDLDTHYRKCICSSIETASHFFTHTKRVGIKEYAVCGGCGYAKDASETPIPITQ